ncbi:hypothetical protein [Georgenia wutianyii]|uniref:hypothetical protein n=1 Tax=Georgenia wutianyii TaxID=2585135 RepID=UPI00143CF2B1|nr:hypothetical protein [Georgenia wutianyii]
MSTRPATLHQALTGEPVRRERLPVPGAALTVLTAAAMFGTLGSRAADLAAWVVLVLGAVLALALAGLRRLPDAREVRRHLGPWPVVAASSVLERVLLIAASVSLAVVLLGVAVPAVRDRGLLPVLVLTAVVLVVHLTAPSRERWRALAAVGWTGAAVVVLLVLMATVGLASGADSDVPDPSRAAAGGGVLAVLVAGALSGVLLRPALPGHRGRPVADRRGTARSLAAGAGVLVTLVAVAAGVPAGGEEPTILGVADVGAPHVLVQVCAVLLAVVLLVTAVTSLSGAVLPARPGEAPAGRETRTGAVLLAAGAALATVLASDVVTLVVWYAVVILLATALTLHTGRRLWSRALETLYQPAARDRARAGRTVTTVAGAAVCASLVLVAVPGWPAVLAIALGSAMMWGVSRHDRELRAALAHVGQDRPLPTAVRAFVVVHAVDRPAVRAVAYARALRATSLEALTVPRGEQEAAARREQWAALDVPVPLVELAATPANPDTAVVEHVATARRAEPAGLAVVYLPELTARGPLRRLLLGRRTARLRARLLALPGTVVTTVPWPLEETSP